MPFTIATWNIRADANIRPEHFPDTPAELLEPRSRLSRILRLLPALGTDVICLQDVDARVWPKILEKLAPFEFDGRHQGIPVGCATLFRKTAFTFRAERMSPFSVTLVLERDGHGVAVSNVHLTGEPQLMEQMDAIVALDPPVHAWVVCGDFKAGPESPLLRLARDRGLSDLHVWKTHPHTCVDRRVDYVLFNHMIKAEPMPQMERALSHPSDHLPVRATLDWAEDTSNRRSFLKRMIHFLSGMEGQDSDWHHDVDKLTLASDSMKSEYRLADAYKQIMSAAEDRRDSMAKEIAGTLNHRIQIPPGWEEARSGIRCIVRDRTWLSMQALLAEAMDEPVPEAPLRRVGPLLQATVVYDTPERIGALDNANLKAWDTPFEDAYRTGEQNLRAASAGRFEEVETGVYRAPWSDGFAAARLLLADLVSQAPVLGRSIALAPNRDALFVAGSDDPVGLKKMIALGWEWIRKPRRMEPVPLILVENEWAEWRPPRPDIERAFGDLRTAARSADFRDQANLLRVIASENRESLSIVEVEGRHTESGNEMTTLCRWPDRFPALIPRTGFVQFPTYPGFEPPGRVFFRGQDPRPDRGFSVPWTAVSEVLGDRLVKLNLTPDRFRIESPLPVNVLHALGGYAVE